MAVPGCGFTYLVWTEQILFLLFFVYLSVIFPCLSAIFRISGNSLDPRSLTYLPVDFVTVLSLLSLRYLSLNFKSQMVNVGGVSEFAQSFLPVLWIFLSSLQCPESPLFSQPILVVGRFYLGFFLPLGLRFLYYLGSLLSFFWRVGMVFLG